MPKTTFMNRFPDGSPRPRLGFWRPDPGDARFMETQDGRLIRNGDFDVPIYEGDGSPEMCCLVSGLPSCPIPYGWYAVGMIEVEERHFECSYEASEELLARIKGIREQQEQERLKELERLAWITFCPYPTEVVREGGIEFTINYDYNSWSVIGVHIPSGMKTHYSSVDPKRSMRDIKRHFEDVDVKAKVKEEFGKLGPRGSKRRWWQL